MRNDEYRARKRRAQRHERKKALAANPDPKCSLCSEVRLPAFELDHVAGEANSDLSNWLCRNDHAVVSDDWYDCHPELLEHEAGRSADARLAALLQGLVIFLKNLVLKLEDWIGYLLGRDQGEQPELPR